jgi:ABC-type uncharacterized transport system, permease component
MRHATDPDHVIAVSTIVARYRQPRHAALIGIAWGIGHTLTILAVGGGIILLGWVIPARVGLSLEFSVGVMLMVLGALTLKGLLHRVAEGVAQTRDDDGVTHSHPHRHGDYIHSHQHHHQPDTHPHTAEATPLARLDGWLGGMRGYQLARPLVVGLVHGLAGSAAVALLVLAAIGNSWWAVVYLLVFGLGTVVGMMLVTAVVGVAVRVRRRAAGWLATGPAGGLGRDQPRLRAGARVSHGGDQRAVRTNPTWTPR